VVSLTVFELIFFFLGLFPIAWYQEGVSTPCSATLGVPVTRKEVDGELI